MRTGSLAGRLVIIDQSKALHVADASGGRFGPDPQCVFDEWSAFRAWAADVDFADAKPFDVTQLDSPVPRPRQVFAIGLNYADHASESGMATPLCPAVFTKFPGCIAGPFTGIRLPPGGDVDWEVEVVAVIGRLARHVSVEDAWQYVAGLTVGQDISERRLQLAGPTPQFSLGKSFEGFAPMGPWLVTPDEFDDPDDLILGCSVNGEVVQAGRTSRMIFSLPQLISHLSSVLPLFPGDVIFTGTPEGVGGARKPPRFLQPGDNLVSWVEGIGEMRNNFEASDRRAVL